MESSVNCNSIGGLEEEDEETLLFVSQAILLQYKKWREVLQREQSSKVSEKMIHLKCSESLRTDLIYSNWCTLEPRSPTM